jgi:hypothetical protein
VRRDWSPRPNRWRTILFVITVCFCASGCGGDSKDSARSANSKLAGQGIRGYEAAYDKYTDGIEACSRLSAPQTRVELMDCFDATFAAAGIRPALLKMDEAIGRAVDLSAGDCLPVMRQYLSANKKLLAAVETFHREAHAGRFARLQDDLNGFGTANDAWSKALEDTNDPC